MVFVRTRGAPSVVGVVALVGILLGSGLLALGPASGATSLGTAASAGTGSAGGAPGVPAPGAEHALGAPGPGCGAPWPAFAALSPLGLGCPGRDQAIVGFYSPLAGGAGNVSLQLTLPVDRAAVDNQSDLYRALWLGLVLHDPYAWLGECLLEVRFQPDAAWNATTGALESAPNAWAGSVVGWQFDPATGTEDTCFDEPMSASGGGAGYLALTGGDTLNITTVGWVGSANGESVTVVDASTGASSVLRGLDDDGAPLDPAYATSTVLDAFSGSSAQIPPVSFGVELAGGANPSIVSNASFGGCTPGLPPATPTDPSVPCPSYNPLSWINDTAAPLQLTPPTFSDASGSARAGELLFSSGIGGSAGVSALSNQTCAGRVGSAYCTYPWFSYACGASALEFGATDYSGITSDFGQSSEFDEENATNVLGYPQFPGTAFAIPGCGAGALNLTLGVSAGSGRVVLNDVNYTTPGSVSLPPGSYLLTAVPSEGSAFAGWTTSGSATVTNATSPSTTLLPGHPGTVTATFTTAPALTTVTFAAAGGGAVFELGPSGGSTENATTPVGAGGSVSLPAGAYPLQVAPALGEVLTAWTSTAGVALTSSLAPATWLLVPSGGGAATVTAALAASTGTTTVVARAVGNGTVLVNGTPIAYTPANETSFGSVVVPAGAVNVTAVPAPGWSFLGWTVLPGAASVFGGPNETNLTLIGGDAFVVGTFLADVTVLSTPGGAGQVSLDGDLPVVNGTVLPLSVGVHTLGAAPAGGEQFVRWHTSAGGNLTVARATLSLTKLNVTGPGTLTAMYANATNETVTFVVAPAAAGTIEFNFRELVGTPTVNGSLTATTYELKSIANYGSKFLNWSVSGPATVSAGELVVSGNNSVVTARFGPKFFPVTFIDTRPGAATLALNGVPQASGTTATLARGVYNLSATVLLQNVSFLSWSSGLPIGNVTPNHLGASVTVDGPGTIYGIVANFVLTGLGLSPSTLDVGAPSHLSIFANGSGPLAYKYLGLPPGCSSADRPTMTCRPTQAGTYPVRASVTDAGGDVATTASDLLTVVGDPLVASFGTVPAATDVGVPVVLNVTVQQGLGPYTYTYTDLPSGCASANAASLPCTPTAAGSFSVLVTVNDSDGLVASAHTPLLVNPDPTVPALNASRTAFDVGMPVVLATDSSGGTGPLAYAYSGLPTGCPTSSSRTLACTPTAPGSWTVTVTVTDAFAKSAQASVALTVNLRPTVASLALSPASLLLGQPTEVTVIASGGTGGLTYSYAGLPSGCASTNTSEFSCTPLAAGSYNITVRVSDVVDGNATRSATLTVTAPTQPGSTPVGGSLGIVWWIVALFALVAIVLAAVLVWRFGRPPEPTT